LDEETQMVQVPSQQIPGVYHRRIGDIVVTALSDGYLDGTVEVLQNITPSDATRTLSEAFRPGRRTSVNCYLIHSAGRLALIETGSGDYLLPTAGKLQASLKAAGVDPAAIEAVILTHMHPDHSAGLTDPKTGARFFPNAELVVNENEPRHWHDDAAMARASERAKRLYFACAREQMAPYHNVMRTFAGSVEVFPGVTSVPLHGHTPGHSGYLIASGAQSLLIWGDIVHVPEIQVPRPDVTIEFDTDPQAAAATRRRLFDMVATDRQLVTGMHMHFPGFSHLVKHGDSYAVVPEPWDQAFGA
jgi:glyoxylase-like metal-dependent hydrolase (beta-lactamase superfamily II)